MSLVVEDGSGVTGANTYWSLADIQSYCNARHYDQTIFEDAVLRAMTFIEAQNWKGYKASQDNALEWPRSDVYDRNGYLVDSDTVPDAVKKALAEASYRESVTQGTLQPDMTTNDMVQSMRVDGAVSVTYYKNVLGGKVFSIIKSLLSGLVHPKGTYDIVRS